MFDAGLSLLQDPATVAWSVLALILMHSLVEYPLWYGPFQMAFGLALGLLMPPLLAALPEPGPPAASVPPLAVPPALPEFEPAASVAAVVPVAASGRTALPLRADPSALSPKLWSPASETDELPATELPADATASLNR